MNHQEYNRLLAEKTTLENMISRIPDEDVIDLKSLKSRLENIKEALSSLQPSSSAPLLARLTFRGKPVVESHGIFAVFGVNILNKFIDAVAGFAAALENPLSATGPIPNRDKSQLLITGTALGSFGFELEHHPPNGELPFDSNVQKALVKATALLEATKGSDDDLAETITESDPRAVSLLREFIKTMADGEAVCALEFAGHSFRFNDVGDVKRSAERLSEENVHEDDPSFEGAIHGVLPKRRTMEFHVVPDDHIIHIKIGSSISSEQTEALNNILYKSVKIKVHSTKVGNGMPRYVLLESPTLLKEDHSTTLTA